MSIFGLRRSKAEGASTSRSPDWFRSTTWSPEDRSRFIARLEKSRGAFHKAQYARIQAHELFEAGSRREVLGAIELLELILASWRSESQLAAVLHQLAKCATYLQDHGRVLESYELAFAEQRLNGGHITDAHLDFGWYCIQRPADLSTLRQALAALEEFQYPAVFPLHTYRDAVLRALIYDRLGEPARAAGHAAAALVVSEVLPPADRRAPFHRLLSHGHLDVPRELEKLSRALPFESSRSSDNE